MISVSPKTSCIQKGPVSGIQAHPGRVCASLGSTDRCIQLVRLNTYSLVENIRLNNSAMSSCHTNTIAQEQDDLEETSLPENHFIIFFKKQHCTKHGPQNPSITAEGSGKN